MSNFKDFFDEPFNESLVHQVVVSYLANSRLAISSQKNRSEVSGGGKKPWKQKGTGRARAGTTRGPIWRGGGVTFAASADRVYSKKVHKKMYRAAMRSILSELNRESRLHKWDKNLPDCRTRSLVAMLGDFDSKSVLIVVDKFDSNLFLAARNLANVCVLEVSKLNPVSLVRYDHVLVSDGAALYLKEVL